MIIFFLIVAVLIALWVVKTLNNFNKKEIRVQESLSGIEVALTNRYDMLTKLLDAAKSYMGHEDALFTKVITLRQGMNIDEMNQVSHELDQVSGKLFAVAEGYPELQSSHVFAELQKGIQDAEAHLQAARRLYNARVTEYNTAISMFPAKLLAGNHRAKEFFTAEAEKMDDVKIEI